MGTFFQNTAQLLDPGALFFDLLLGALRGIEDLLLEVGGAEADGTATFLVLIEQFTGVLSRPCRRPGAYRNRTRRCPRTANYTRMGRARPYGWSMVWSAGYRRRSRNNRFALATSMRSPNSWEQSLTNGGLTTAGTGAGEFEHRWQQLTAFQGRTVDQGRIGIRQIEEKT